MSVLAYNNVALPFCHSEDFRLEAVRDDLSQTDRIVTKYDIRVQTTIFADALDMIAPLYMSQGITQPAAILAIVQESLMQDRKQLSFKFNDYEFVPQPAGVSGYVDALNGPKPQSCQIMRMDEGVWLLTYHIIAHYVVKYSFDVVSGRVTATNLPGNVVLFNRWTERADLDNCQYTTRTRSGKFMIRSDNNNGLMPDEVRGQLAVVSVPTGFVRDRSNYTVSPDGLGMTYEVVDREVYRMPPYPAFEADGEYEEDTARGDGKKTARCRVRLRAPKGTNHWDLMRRAVAVCVGKISTTAGVGNFLRLGEPLGGTGVLTFARVKSWLYDNQVEVSIGVLLADINLRIQGVCLTTNNLNVVPNSDGTNPPIPYKDRGSANLLLLAASYYDPLLNEQLRARSTTGNQNLDTPPGDSRVQMAGREPGTTANIA